MCSHNEKDIIKYNGNSSECEEGEIIDSFEWISSTEEEEISYRQNMELETNEELKRIARISESYQTTLMKAQHITTDMIYRSDVHRPSLVPTEISSISSDEFVTPKKLKKRRKTKTKRTKSYHLPDQHRFNQRNHYGEHRKRRRSLAKSKGKLKFDIQNVDPISKSSNSYDLILPEYATNGDEDKESVYINRKKLRLALARNTNAAEITTQSLKERLQANRLENKEKNQNNLLTRLLNEVTNNDTDANSNSPNIPEEQELRLIALKSAVLKKHLARKKRNAEQPYSPTDFDVCIAKIEKTEDDLNVGEEKLCDMDNAMDISPFPSPKLPSPEPEMNWLKLGQNNTEESSQFASDQTVDMDIVNSDSGEAFSNLVENKIWPPLEQILLPDERRIAEMHFSTAKFMSFNYGNSFGNIQFEPKLLPPGVLDFEEPPPPPPFRISPTAENSFKNLHNINDNYFTNNATSNETFARDLTYFETIVNNHQTPPSIEQFPERSALEIRRRQSVNEQSSDEEKALRTLLLSKFLPDKSAEYKNRNVPKEMSIQPPKIEFSNSNETFEIPNKSLCSLEKPTNAILKQAVLRLNSKSRTDNLLQLNVNALKSEHIRPPLKVRDFAVEKFQSQFQDFLEDQRNTAINEEFKINLIEPNRNQNIIKVTQSNNELKAECLETNTETKINNSTILEVNLSNTLNRCNKITEPDLFGICKLSANVNNNSALDPKENLKYTSADTHPFVDENSCELLSPPRNQVNVNKSEKPASNTEPEADTNKTNSSITAENINIFNNMPKCNVSKSNKPRIVKLVTDVHQTLQLKQNSIEANAVKLVTDIHITEALNQNANEANIIKLATDVHQIANLKPNSNESSVIKLVTDVSETAKLKPNSNEANIIKLQTDGNQTAKLKQKSPDTQPDLENRIIALNKNIPKPSGSNAVMSSRLITSIDTPPVKKLIIELRASDTESSDDEIKHLCRSTIALREKPGHLLKTQREALLSKENTGFVATKSYRTVVKNANTTIVEPSELEKNQFFEEKLDIFLKNVRSNVQQENATAKKSSGLKSRNIDVQTAKSLTTSVVECHLPEASQKEYRRLVHRMRLLEKQKFNQNTKKCLNQHVGTEGTSIQNKLHKDMQKSKTPNKRKLAVPTSSHSTVQHATESPKMPTSDASKSHMLHVYEKAFHKTSSAIVMNLNKSLKLVDTAKKVKFDKFRYEQRLNALHNEIAKVQQKLTKEQENMSKIYPEICSTINVIASLKKRRHKLCQVATSLGNKMKGEDYRFNNEFKSEISSKSKTLAAQIKHVNSIKYSNFEEIQDFANIQVSQEERPTTSGNLAKRQISQEERPTTSGNLAKRQISQEECPTTSSYLAKRQISQEERPTTSGNVAIRQASQEADPTTCVIFVKRQVSQEAAPMPCVTNAKTQVSQEAYTATSGGDFTRCQASHKEDPTPCINLTKCQASQREDPMTCINFANIQKELPTSSTNLVKSQVSREDATTSGSKSEVACEEPTPCVNQANDKACELKSVQSCSFNNSNPEHTTMKPLQEPLVPMDCDISVSNTNSGGPSDSNQSFTEACHDSTGNQRISENDKDTDAASVCDEDQSGLIDQPRLSGNILDAKVLPDYNSPLVLRTYESHWNPNGVICPYELMGQCEDFHCEFVHFSKEKNKDSQEDSQKANC